MTNIAGPILKVNSFQNAPKYSQSYNEGKLVLDVLNNLICNHDLF